MAEKKATKKVAEKKVAEKKVTEKKATTKKTTTAKKAAAPKVTKKSVQDYMDVINWKKWEAHHMDWLYIEINAGDLLQELEAGVSNMTTCNKAMKECMLEGDNFLVDAKRASASLTVRYYCDNLSESRRKYTDVQ